MVSGQVGRGTFVLGSTVDAALFAGSFERGTASIIDLASNVPAQRPDDDDLTQALRAIGRRTTFETGYPRPATLLRGQAVIADLLRERSFFVSDGDVVLAAGAQQALLATLAVVVGAGGRILVEELTFPGMKSVARHLNLQLVPVRMDAFGLLPHDLARQIKSSGATALVCVPCRQNPTTATMSATRRVEIARVVEKTGLTVIEDDVYGLLQDEPAFASASPANTLVVTSLSKCVAPGLRIGAVAGRHPALDTIRREVSLTSWTVSPAMISAAALWIEDGTLHQRIAWQRSEINARNRLFPPNWQGPDSPHRWLPTQTNPDQAVAVLRELGVATVSSHSLSTRASAPKGIRLSISAAVNRAELHSAIAIISNAPIRWAASAPS